MTEIFKFFEPFPKNASQSEYRIVSIDRLIPTRGDEPLESSGFPKSVEKALQHIQNLCKGVQGATRRPPIKVKDNQDGTFSIIDGNAAFSAYKHLGWKELPIRIKLL